MRTTDELNETQMSKWAVWNRIKQQAGKIESATHWDNKGGVDQRKVIVWSMEV